MFQACAAVHGLFRDATQAPQWYTKATDDDP